MGLYDHETDIDGEHIPKCRECELEVLRILARAVDRYTTGPESPEEWDIMVAGVELWKEAWGQDG